MKYLKKFETEADKDAWLGSTDFVTPNVVLIGEDLGYNLKPQPELIPLYIEAVQNLTVNFSKSYQYSKDKSKWSTATSSTSVSVNSGEKVYFRTKGITPSQSSGMGHFFISNGNCKIGGNIMSMVYSNDFIGQTTIGQYQFVRMFEDCSNIIDASQLVLPSDNLPSYCYSSMFKNCTNLASASKLPAMVLGMFCYDNMYSGCSSLVIAPELPAIALQEYCYNNMFAGCSKLSYIKAMFTTKPKDSYTCNWLSGVAPTGTFVKNAAATWDVIGVNGIPYGWTVETASE